MPSRVLIARSVLFTLPVSVSIAAESHQASALKASVLKMVADSCEV